MSGICAILCEPGRAPDAGLVGSMAAAAAHRGPDGTAVWSAPGVGLAHLALHATAEAVSESQPLSDPGPELVITADARIDNRSELVAELSPTVGSPGESLSDARLILAAYERWGESCPERLLGDFAFAIWDARRRRLFCARDPLGVKPLHYARTGASLCVASEASQILAHPGVEQRVDEVFLGRYLAAALEDPERSPFAGIRRLRPAHRLVCENGRMTTERYWRPDPSRRITYRRDEEYVDGFREILGRAVSDRLRTQGEAVGIQLSGGLDSSSLAAIASRVLAEMESPPLLIALSAIFERLRDCDESSLIRKTVERLGLEAHEFRPEERWLLREPEEYRPALESPFLGWATVEREMLRRLRERGGRVVFTGHGGDSVLFGSPLAYADLLRRGRLLRLAADLRHHASSRAVPLHKLIYLYLAKPIVPRWLLEPSRRLAGGRKADPRPPWMSESLARRADLDGAAAVVRESFWRGDSRAVHARMATLLGDVTMGIDWIDRAASRFGIEARHPFLDRRIIEYVIAVPSRQNFEAGTGKLLLRRALEGELPEAVLRRRDKALFRTFLDYSLREKERSRVAALLDDSRLAALGAVDPGKLRQAVKAFFEGGEGGLGLLAWRVVTAELWLRRHDLAGGADGVLSLGVGDGAVV